MGRVLLIDDEPAVLAILQKALERLGIECDTADSALSGIAHIKENEYDLIICDYLMPDANGDEVYRALREIHPNREGDFFILSAYHPEFTDRSSEFVRSTGCLWKMKPNELNELIAAMGETLRGRGRD